MLVGRVAPIRSIGLRSFDSTDTVLKSTIATKCITEFTDIIVIVIFLFQETPFFAKEDYFDHVQRSSTIINVILVID